LDFVGGFSTIPLPKKIPDTATAIIISDDPFFQANRATLIPLANNWLDDPQHPQRHIVYPSRIYESLDLPAAQRPRSGKSSIVGPDYLSKAYLLLGVLAGALAKDRGLNFGFFTLPNDTIPL
jgi:hypothetical protein